MRTGQAAVWMHLLPPSFICATVKQIQMSFLHRVPSDIHNTEKTYPGLWHPANKLPRELSLEKPLSDTGSGSLSQTSFAPPLICPPVILFFPLPYLFRTLISPYLTSGLVQHVCQLHVCPPQEIQSCQIWSKAFFMWTVRTKQKAHCHLSGLRASCDLWSCIHGGCVFHYM